MAKQTDKITNILHAYRSGHRIPGMAAGIIMNGQIFYVRGFGSADTKSNRLFTADTLFALQDITSLFTAQSMLHLQCRSDFNIDAPIRKYLSDLDAQELELLTTRHILNHETGFANDFPIVSSFDQETSAWHKDIPAYRVKLQETEKFLIANPIHKRDDFVSAFNKLPQRHIPGTRTGYYIDPFILAANILERISGLTWEAYIASHVFQSIGLQNSRIHMDQAAENGASYYINTIDQPMEAPAPYNPLGAPISSIFSTVNDMLIFLQNRLRHLGCTNAITVGVSPVYRQGWHVEQTEGDQVWSLSGNQLGGSSYIEMVPAKSYGLVIFANMDMLRLPALGRKIRRLLLQ